MGFSLNLDLGLEFAKSIVQVHTREVHFIHHAAETQNQGQSKAPWPLWETVLIMRTAMRTTIMHSILSLHSLQNILVELFLPVSQELSNHLSAQTLPLQDEAGDPDRSV